MERPPEQTWTWVQGLVGQCEPISQYAHSHGYSKLWRLKAGGEFLWLKMHAYPNKWAGEVYALTHWTPELGMTPRVVGVQENPCAVILTELPGIDAEVPEFTSEQEERMWSAAGDWLRRLHTRTNDWFGGINPDGSPSGKAATDPEAFVAATFEQRLREGQEMDLLDRTEREFIERGVREWLPALKGELPHSIHRDYTPRNWLANPDGALSAIIDFEHARWDVRAADMNRWWDWDFLRNPRLKDAFFEAYGVPDEVLATQIKTLRLLNAAGGVVWATKVNDHPFAQRNREALHRMMAEES